MDNQKGKEPPPQQSEVMTEGMKAFTPGTPEFLKRTTNIQKRVDKAKKIAKNKLGNNNVDLRARRTHRSQGRHYPTEKK